ncbi:MAG: ATPase [Bacteroidota bacterium]
MQIDLLIDRNDGIINVCEIKYSDTEFTIQKTYAQHLRNKARIFRESTKTKKQLMFTMLTTYGVNHKQHSLGYIEHVLTLDDLFAD